jgi:mRNA interferase MazF
MRSTTLLKKSETGDLPQSTGKLREKLNKSTLIWREPLPMESIKKGDLFWVNFDPTLGAEAKKIRPAVVVSNDINNEHSPIISIAPITSSVTRVYSFEVEIPAGTANLTSRSKIMVNQTRAIDKVRLGQRLGRLPDALMVKVKEALKLHYDLN